MSTSERSKDEGKRTRKPKLHYAPEDYVCERFENDPTSFNGKVPPHGGWRAHGLVFAEELAQLQEIHGKYKQLGTKVGRGRKTKSGSSSSSDRGFTVSSNNSGDDTCSTPIKRRRGRPLGSGKKSSVVGKMTKDGSTVVKRGRGRPRRNNQAIDNGKQTENKWESYKKNAMKYVRAISQGKYVVDVYQQDKGHQDMGFARDEINRYRQKIHSSKRLLKDLVKQIVEENMDHTQFEQLKGGDDDNMVDINDVYCSVCNLDAVSEENDIVLCDRVGKSTVASRSLFCSHCYLISLIYSLFHRHFLDNC